MEILFYIISYNICNLVWVFYLQQRKRQRVQKNAAITKKNVVIVLKRWWTWLDVIPGDCLKTTDMNELYCWSLILLDPAHKVWFLYLKLHYGTAFSRILSFAIPVMFFLLLLLLLFITYHFCFKWTQPFIFTPETVHEWQLQ